MDNVHVEMCFAAVFLKGLDWGLIYLVGLIDFQVLTVKA